MATSKLKEETKWIKGYEGVYKISNFGRVISVPRKTTKGGLLTLVKNSVGYFQVTLSKNGKSKNILVHRLVALNFIPNKNYLPYVNHKDEDKTNNHADNLEWCTREYSFGYGTTLKRRAITQGKPIKGTNIKTGENIYFFSGMEAGRNGFSQACISKCCLSEQRKHKDYVWEFITKEEFNNASNLIRADRRLSKIN
ncbi:NUMOD4 motif-containing HNH endonuclease [Tetragenococcus koreensis]|uniref:NUMOD4 domain-containing protein n=1 Tax=Tetragenococcus koreensis TaxID=290335 RepID=UPI001F2599D2|nr:NUMOD4 domain-containing protein [Tetragenococcus koreensis]MCF1614660.1 NUMOD4 motif-containing HNH endonuclease [Tetragenococcus koreensis]MCF1624421.1 NUMOD4 motif-containing HNH endonuclease [Tetragenococcus koreensis]